MRQINYLDNAASSFPKPKTVAKAVADTINLVGANPGRGGHKLALKADAIVYDTRVAIAQMFNLPSPERIIFTGSATEAMNLALKGITAIGSRVAISRLEHNAVIRPLACLEKRGVRVERAPCNENGLPNPSRIPAVQTLVTVAGSNVTGALADVPALADACRAKKVTLVVDAAQTAGSIPLDAGNVDILVCAGHKGLLGPQGTGFAWFAPGIEPETMIEGGTGSSSAAAAMPLYWPDRHEAGTLNTPGIAGLKAGVEYLRKRGVETVREKEIALCKTLIEKLGSDPRITLYPPFDPQHRASLVCFNARGVDPSELGDALDRRGIACRVGLHCSPEAHRFMGTFPTGAVRISPGAMTRKKDIVKFTETLDKILRRL